MSDIRCEGCQTVIDPGRIDWQRELASCGRCGRLMELLRTDTNINEIWALTAG